MKPTRLEGIIPAIVCPMLEDYSVDEDSLRNYVKWISSFRIGGLAVNVDTGEGFHLLPEERLQVIRIVKEVAGGKIPIIAGLQPGYIPQTVGWACGSRDAGADALLVFPSSVFAGGYASEVVYEYYRTIYEGAGIPLVVFQLQPDLGGVIFDQETLRLVTSLEGVIAVKEASFDARKFLETLRIVKKFNPRVSVLTGNDNFIYESLALGADGALIGFGTIGTDLLIEMYELTKNGRYKEAMEIASRLQPLADVIFAPPVRAYRARLKEALAMLGIIRYTYVRPPLKPIPEGEKEAIRKALIDAGIL
ncbi:MAG: dihydrodipicolinate synthase family protein [Candidatus Bathyarchaeota archaeon]|nr:dihydrodipicolinate synthase family protein [Candidatus Bathyarchaeota archaeon]